MNIDLYTASGIKKGTMELPAALFEAPINRDLMHQALIRQQSNRRNAIAHAKNRGEVEGSTRKVYAQKHTGRARRGQVRSPLMRGGGKAFGPRSNANFIKDMPKSMRRSALLSCLSQKAKDHSIVGLESFGDTPKTKVATELLKKLPVELGRRILIVLAGSEKSLSFAVRNIPRVRAIDAAYLNPEDILVARHIVFLAAAVKKAEELWGGEKKQKNEKNHRKQQKQRLQRKTTSSTSSRASVSSVSSSSSSSK